VTQILDSKEGSYDEHSPWAVARLNFVLQLLVQFGLMAGLAAWAFVASDNEDLPLDTDSLPTCFILTEIGELDLMGTDFWVESHNQSVAGGKGHDGAGPRTQTRYRRNADEQLDSNGNFEMGPRCFGTRPFACALFAVRMKHTQVTAKSVKVEKNYIYLFIYIFWSNEQYSAQ
jgi:hypothetical protein